MLLCWGHGSSWTRGGGGAAAPHGHPWRASSPGPGERGWAHTFEADQPSLVLRAFWFKESPGEGTHFWPAESTVVAISVGAGEGGVLFSLPQHWGSSHLICVEGSELLAWFRSQREHAEV